MTDLGHAQLSVILYKGCLWVTQLFDVNNRLAPGHDQVLQRLQFLVPQ